MPTFVNMSACDGCGKCVEICPSDIMHIDKKIRRAYNIEPDYCWECYSCVKACPQHAIDMRGYADFCPLGHALTVLREPEKGQVSWKVRYRNGSVKQFTFPVRSTPEGSIKPPQETPSPAEDIRSQLLSHEPEYLKVPSLPIPIRGGSTS